MRIKVYPDTKIYVAAPANIATGGPELLHQLVYHMRKDLNINAYMYYFPNNHPKPVHEEYKKYNNPFVRKLDDKSENILIVPETIDGLKILLYYPRIRKIIWWLSVDNFYISYILKTKKKFLLRRMVNKLAKIFLKKIVFDIEDVIYKTYFSNDKFKFKLDSFLKDLISKANYHMVQSYYAYEHLKNIGLNENLIFYLSDYINLEFFNTSIDISQKEDIVVYNPKKGFSFTRKLIKYAPDIKFIPLINMSRKEVIKVLKRAKVYIDFGNHPGKDRIPREAAILGCCVITGKRGSARYFEDVPIPEQYKFDQTESNIPIIINKIRDCFENYRLRYKDFDNYRRIIRGEPRKFIKDLKNIFVVM